MIDSETNSLGEKKNGLKSIKVSPEIHRQIKTEASSRAQEIGEFVTWLWSEYRDGHSTRVQVQAPGNPPVEVSGEVLRLVNALSVLFSSTDPRDAIFAKFLKDQLELIAKELN